LSYLRPHPPFVAAGRQDAAACISTMN
jgi:hypothetical protein